MSAPPRTAADAATWPVVRLAGWTWLAVVGASIALGPLTQSQRFLVVGGLAAALVLATGVVLRLVRAPWPVVALAQAVVLVLWGTVTFARGEATLGVLPNPDVLRTWQQMVEATVEHSQTYPAPVPRLVAFESTVAWAVGGVALVADLLVSGLRRAPLVGLLFLGIYMAPVSILSGDVGVVAFVPGALGYVFLLVAAQRDESARWGRDLDDAAGADVRRGAALSAVGQKAGLGAIACAVVLPVVVPTFPTTYFGTGGTAGEGSGSGGVTLEDPTQDLQRNLGEQSRAELIRMTSTAGAPSYLRLAALTELDDGGWAPGQRASEDETSIANVLPTAPGQATEVATEQISYDVQVSDQFSTRWLPTTFAPTSVEVDGSWRLDRLTMDIAARRGGARSDFAYSFSAAVPRPTPDQLRAALAPSDSVEDELDLPRDIPDVIAERADEVTAGEETDFDKALALQRWFRRDGGFTYDVRPRAGDGFETLADFVTDDRRGYCEQFAGAMAAMARAEGIPSRVAVGFLRPEREGESYVFRGTDMHAWPELYFENVGWVQFEPTPGGDNYEAPDFESADPTSGPSGTATEEAPTASPTAERTRETAGPIAAGADDEGDSGAGRFLGTAAAVVVAVGALALLPLLASALVLARRRRRATTGAERAEVLWRSLLEHARDLGIAVDGTLTPRGVGRTLAHRLPPDPDVKAALDRVVGGVERARYARTFDETDLGPDVRRVTHELAAGRPRLRRWRARWVPLAWATGARRRDRSAGSGGGVIRTGLLDLREQD